MVDLDGIDIRSTQPPCDNQSPTISQAIPIPGTSTGNNEHTHPLRCRIYTLERTLAAFDTFEGHIGVLHELINDRGIIPDKQKLHLN
jgi:hypothetical protein